MGSKIVLKYLTITWHSSILTAGICMLLCGLYTSNSFAQNKVVYEDVIQLRTTEKIRGQIVDSIPGVSVNIRRHNQEITTIWSEDIYKILREPYQEDAVYTKKSNKPGVEFEDVILLKSAEVLRGKITENIPEKSVTILLNDQTSRTVERSEISQILKEKKRYYASKTESKTAVSASAQDSDSDAKMQIYLELGYGFDFSENEMSPIRINFIPAAGFNGFGSVGGGLGLRYIGDQDKLLLPLFADFRVSPFDNKISPFAGFSMGSTIQTAEGTDIFSGVFIHAQMGLEIAKRKNSGVMFSVGFEQFNVQEQELYTGFLYPITRVITRSVQTLTFNVAFRF